MVVYLEHIKVQKMALHFDFVFTQALGCNTNYILNIK